MQAATNGDYEILVDLRLLVECKRIFQTPTSFRDNQMLQILCDYQMGLQL